MVRDAVDAQEEHHRVEEFVELLVGSVQSKWHCQVLGSVPKMVEDEVLGDPDALGFLVCQLGAVPILNVMVAFGMVFLDINAVSVGFMFELSLAEKGVSSC
jgi:hypothetical protein